MMNFFQSMEYTQSFFFYVVVSVFCTGEAFTGKCYCSSALRKMTLRNKLPLCPVVLHVIVMTSMTSGSVDIWQMQ